MTIGSGSLRPISNPDHNMLFSLTDASDFVVSYCTLQFVTYSAYSPDEAVSGVEGDSVPDLL